MAKVILDMAMSLDGFISGPNGEDHGLHDYFFSPAGPTAILTHHLPEQPAKGAESFVFVTDGIESALEQARAVTGDRHIVIGGGANIAQQYLHAGLLDEIQIHLVHTLLDQGLRLFDQMGVEPMRLVKTRAVDSVGVIHLRFRVIK